MKFLLNIRTDNAAFEDGNARFELARILRDVAKYIESGGDYAMFQTIHDVNGNDVGRFALKHDDYETNPRPLEAR